MGVVGALSCGIIFVTTFMLGPSLFAIPNLSGKIAVAMYCPGAESTSIQEGVSTPTTTSPSGGYGYAVEITCTFTDGSTKVIRNEQFALASIGGMWTWQIMRCWDFHSADACAFFLIRKKKES
jgi:hypothetical protein